jgi:hypothetical protein
VRAVLDVANPVRVRTDVDLQFTVRTATGTIRNDTVLVGGQSNDIFAIPVRGDASQFAFGFQGILTASGAGPDRVYFLAIPVLGRIPDPRFRLRDRDLHRTDARYHTQGVDAVLGDRIEFPFHMPGTSFSSNDFAVAAMPGRRLEFHSPDVRWSGPMLQQYVPGGPKLFFEGAIDVPDVVYRAGKSVRQDWNAPVFGAPGVRRRPVRAELRQPVVPLRQHAAGERLVLLARRVRPLGQPGQ